MKAVLTVGLAVIVAAVFAWFMGGQPSADKTPPATADSRSIERLASAKTDTSSNTTDTAKTEPGFAAVQSSDDTRRLLLQTNVKDRNRDLAILISRTLDTEALRRLITVMMELGKEGHPLKNEWEHLWYALAARDPAAAIALADSFGKENKWYDMALNAAIYRWGKKDSAGATKWLNSRQDIDGKALDNLMLSLVQGFASVDAVAAAAFVTQNFPPTGSGSAHQAVTSSFLAQQGAPGLQKWFNGLTDIDTKKRWFGSVANRLGEVDPELKRQWMKERAAEPYRNDLAFRDLITAWADEDPIAAMGYAVSLPPSPTNGEYAGLGGASYGWLLKDPSGFDAYYRQLPEGPVKQGILKVLKSTSADPNMPGRKVGPARTFLAGIGELPESQR